MTYRIFAGAIVVAYAAPSTPLRAALSSIEWAALGVVSVADKRPREAVIAFLFAASNAAIFCWR
jgi:hypothetical protein